MFKINIENREYKVSLVNEVITISVIDWPTPEEYSCDIDETYLLSYKLINTMNNLFDFITEELTSNNINSLLFTDHKLILSLTLDSKYISEKYEFVLNECTMNDNKMHICLKHQQQKIDDLENKVSKLQNMVSQLIELHHIQLPDGNIIDSGIHLKTQKVPEIKIRYDEKGRFVISSSSRELIFLNTMKDIKSILNQYTFGIDKLWIRDMNVKDFKLSDIIPEKCKIHELYLVDMPSIIDYFDVKAVSNLVILVSCDPNIDWKDVISKSAISRIYVHNKIPTNFSAIDYYSFPLDGKYITTNMIKGRCV